MKATQKKGRPSLRSGLNKATFVTDAQKVLLAKVALFLQFDPYKADFQKTLSL